MRPDPRSPPAILEVRRRETVAVSLRGVAQRCAVSLIQEDAANPPPATRIARRARSSATPERECAGERPPPAAPRHGPVHAGQRGRSGMYATQDDLIERFGETKLIQLTDRTNRPATTIDADVVTARAHRCDGARRRLSRQALHAAAVDRAAGARPRHGRHRLVLPERLDRRQGQRRSSATTRSPSSGCRTSPRGW